MLLSSGGEVDLFLWVSEIWKKCNAESGARANFLCPLFCSAFFIFIFILFQILDRQYEDIHFFLLHGTALSDGGYTGWSHSPEPFKGQNLCETLFVVCSFVD